MGDAQQAQIPAGICFVRAYAKINLTLDVLGRRADGYHELATVMQTVDLYDTLCLTPIPDRRVEVISTVPALDNNDNLAARAAQLLIEYSGVSTGVSIELHKRIPIAAGLGGGSSDAVAVLLALRQWWHLPISMEEMHTLAASIGSDVPFFLDGGLALCEGRGERVTPLPPRYPVFMRWLLLLKPPVGLSTATVFRQLPASDYTDGRYSRAFSTAIQTGEDPRTQDLHNSLERGVLEQYPEVARAKADMVQAGAPLVQLSGSGPTLFAPFPALRAASETQQRLVAQGYDVYLSRAIQPNGGHVCFV